MWSIYFLTDNKHLINQIASVISFLIINISQLLSCVCIFSSSTIFYIILQLSLHYNFRNKLHYLLKGFVKDFHYFALFYIKLEILKNTKWNESMKAKILAWNYHFHLHSGRFSLGTTHFISRVSLTQIFYRILYWTIL